MVFQAPHSILQETEEPAQVQTTLQFENISSIKLVEFLVQKWWDFLLFLQFGFLKLKENSNIFPKCFFPIV